MRTIGATHPWRRGWVLGLALLSLAVPLAAFFLRSEPLVPFDDPARLSYYRQTVVALALALAAAVAAFVGQRALAPTWARLVSVLLASLGLLVGVYLLWSLVGTCGVQVLWGQCNP